MADTIDEAMIIAWVDGELDAADAARVETAIAAEPELGALADRHQRMRTRFAAAFGALAEEPVKAPAPAPVISLAAVRAEREAAKAPPPRRWYAMGGAIAASLIAGVLVGQQMVGGAKVEDKANMLALSAPLSKALDSQLSGDAGVVRVALSFRDRDDHVCRSFEGQHLSGVACRNDGAWQLRYATPTGGQKQGDYRMAGTSPAQAQVIDAMIAGEPLDRTAEASARDHHWTK